MEQEWMKDSSLIGIDRKKLDYMQKMFVESQKLSQKELMPFFMALAAKSKKDHISFTPEETQAVVAVLRKNSTPEEVQKIDTVMKKFGGR